MAEKTTDNHCQLQSRPSSIQPTVVQTTRRTLLAAGVACAPILSLVGPLPSFAEGASLATTSEFVRYISESQGYSLTHPASWEEQSKAGADVLFRDPDSKGTTLGVTVFPVTVRELDKFGTIGEVGEKLLGAERAKESTLGVEMLTQEQRSTEFGTVYDFVYELESTRGRKRIVNTVAIVNSKLYIVNGVVGCGKEACGIGQDASVEVLQQAAKSLEII